VEYHHFNEILVENEFLGAFTMNVNFVKVTVFQYFSSNLKLDPFRMHIPKHESITLLDFGRLCTYTSQFLTPESRHFNELGVNEQIITAHQNNPSSVQDPLNA